MLYSLSEIPIGTVVEKRIEYENNFEHNFYAKFKKISNTEFLILEHSWFYNKDRVYTANTHSKSFISPSWKMVSTPPKTNRPIRWI